MNGRPHSRSVEEVLTAHGASLEGLTPEEARRRLAAHGENEVVQTGGRTPLAIFLAQFDSVLIWVLVVAAGLSAWAGHTVDAAELVPGDVIEFEKLYVVRWLRETPTFSNRWLALAVGGSVALQFGVLYTPLADYFGTVPLALGDWAVIGAVLVAGLPAYLASRTRSNGTLPPRRTTEPPAVLSGPSSRRRRGCSRP